MLTYSLLFVLVVEFDDLFDGSALFNLVRKLSERFMEQIYRLREKRNTSLDIHTNKKHRPLGYHCFRNRG